jgi:hypothetical protein
VCACMLAALSAGAARATTGYPGLLQNDSPPRIAGDLAVGGIVSATPGGWSGEGPIAYAYQWQHCQPSCVSVPGATAPTYAVGSGDLSGRLRVVVTASNSAASYAMPSAVTLPVAPPAAEVQAAMIAQLAPRTSTIAVAIALATRDGYQLPFDAPVAGRLTVAWYRGSHPLLSPAVPSSELVARGNATIRAAGLGVVAMKLTARGRALIARSRRVVLTAVAGLKPAESLSVSAVRVFTL